jgi:hypothetical protein
MFTKVLIADDIDFNDLGAAQILNELDASKFNMQNIVDEALLKVKKANLDGTPFQLISDLSFKEDHQLNKLNSGEELIAAVKGCPTLK